VGGFVLVVGVFLFALALVLGARRARGDQPEPLANEESP
jgi:hypothetical protein